MMALVCSIGLLKDQLVCKENNCICSCILQSTGRPTTCGLAEGMKESVLDSNEEDCPMDWGLNIPGMVGKLEVEMTQIL